MMRTIVEDLNYASQEPSSQAAMQAQQLGLVYVGFGRYEDPRTKQITHIVQNDQLVPFRKAIKTNEYKTQQTDDIGNFVNAISPEAQQTLDMLTQTYGPNSYDENEIAAIQDFSSQSYSDINDYLSNFPSGTPIKQMMPEGPDDNRTDIIGTLDSAMKRVRAPMEFITYTKLGSDGDKSQIIPGTQFKLKGFRNTTVNLGTVLSQSDPSSTVLQIRVKKNSRGIYTGQFSQNPEEAEFILPRGTKIEVLAGPTKLVGSDGQSGGKNKEIYYYDCVTKS